MDEDTCSESASKDWEWAGAVRRRKAEVEEGERDEGLRRQEGGKAGV